MDLDKLYKGLLTLSGRIRTVGAWVLFVVIRSLIWGIWLMLSAPQPLEWLRGVVIEREVDDKLFFCYLYTTLIVIGMYLLNLFVWSLPFIPVRQFWNVLKFDIISFLIVIILSMTSYLSYVQYLSASYPL